MAALLVRIRVGQWTHADIQTLEGKSHDKRLPAEGAVHFVAVRHQVAKCNNHCNQDLAACTNVEIHESTAANISLNSGLPGRGHAAEERL